MKLSDKVYLILIALMSVIAVGITLSVLSLGPSSKYVKIQKAAPENKTNISSNNQKTQNNGITALQKTSQPFKVKGIYLTGWSVGSKSKLQHFINLLNRTELNTLVIDVKDDLGRLSYKSEVPLAKEIDSSVNMIADIKSVINTLKYQKIHTIARIVVFKDPILAEKRPDLALKTSSGKVWHDRNGLSWLDPTNKNSWNYSIALAREAAKIGFDEVQFDYVRFPADGKVKDISNKNIVRETDMSKYINEFLPEVSDQFIATGITAPISADIFGIVTTNKGDVEKIGQDLEQLCLNVNYLSPMVYPSHYAFGQYNIKKPDFSPYHVVYKSMSTAKQRIEKVNGNRTILRPYLQDFTASWLGRGNYKKYTANDVRAQIKAVYDSGLDEWILWNANNRYSESAFLPEG